MHTYGLTRSSLSAFMLLGMLKRARKGGCFAVHMTLIMNDGFRRKTLRSVL